MPIDTSKSISKVTYNNVEIPLYTKPEQEKTITPTAIGVAVTPDIGYTLSKVTVNGDSNLTVEHIKSGVKIFGVTGTYNNAKPEQIKTVDLSMASGNQVISPDNGKVLSKVIINKPSTLIPDNIKKNVNIGGVVGTLESSSGSSTTASNIITFECTANSNTFSISHDILVANGIDTEDKFYKIVGISIIPKNGDVDWFCTSYGGTLNKTAFNQTLTYLHGANLTFYNLSGTLPYQIQLATETTNDIVGKNFIITLVLSN